MQAKDKYSNTPLYLAASSGQTSTVELLLEKGAPIEARDRYDNTSFHLAALTGHTSVVQLLLRKGASPVALSWRQVHV